MEYITPEVIDELGFFSPRGNLDGEMEAVISEKERLIGFKIAEEIFYMPIADVSEILMILPITYVPRSGPYIEGVINVRGTIIPTVNLRKMMGYDRTSATMSSRIIIIRWENIYTGILVDAITVVASFSPFEIENQSLPTKNPSVDIITRVSKVDGKICGILDGGKILTAAGYEKPDSEAEENSHHAA